MSQNHESALKNTNLKACPKSTSIETHLLSENNFSDKTLKFSVFRYKNFFWKVKKYISEEIKHILDETIQSKALFFIVFQK